MPLHRFFIMANPPIKNLEKTVENLENLAQFTNFAKLVFNEHVNAVYYKNTEEHVQAKKALLIKDKDSQISICNKQLLFFLSLQKLEQQVSDKFILGNMEKVSLDGMLTGEIKLNPSIKYKDGKSVGTRQIKVPHLDESKLGNLRNFTFTHGKTVVIYKFDSRKMIKVLAIDKAEGIRAIGELLKIVESKHILGKPEDHCYVGNMPKDMKDGDLHGIPSKGTAIHISDTHGKLYTVFI